MSQNLLLIDVETTRPEDAKAGATNPDVIEVGALWVTTEGRVIASFRSFVRPEAQRALGSVTRRETGITQAEADGAPRFPAVAARLAVFARQHASPAAHWMSWGSSAARQLAQACDQHKISNPLQLPHFNAKQLFARHQQIPAEVGLRKACALAQVGEIPGAHRALNDALAISWLLPWVFGSALLPAPVNRA